MTRRSWLRVALNQLKGIHRARPAVHLSNDQAHKVTWQWRFVSESGAFFNVSLAPKLAASFRTLECTRRNSNSLLIAKCGVHQLTDLACSQVKRLPPLLMMSRIDFFPAFDSHCHELAAAERDGRAVKLRRADVAPCCAARDGRNSHGRAPAERRPTWRRSLCPRILKMPSFSSLSKPLRRSARRAAGVASLCALFFVVTWRLNERTWVHMLFPCRPRGLAVVAQSRFSIS